MAGWMGVGYKKFDDTLCFPSPFPNADKQTQIDRKEWCRQLVLDTMTYRLHT